MSLNNNSTKIAVIDLNGVLTLLQINAQGGNLLEFEKKDCWNVKFSDDHPDFFCFMEKSRLYIVNGLEADEPVSTESYIC